jgi:hypothetical protein
MNTLVIDKCTTPGVQIEEDIATFNGAQLGMNTRNAPVINDQVIVSSPPYVDH